MHLIVFADLDGTLLDADTYSAAAAAPGLVRLAEAGARLVPCTTKTASEIEALAPLLRALAPSLTLGPAIIENGAAIVDLEASAAVEQLGTSYEELRAALAAARRELRLPLVGFGDVDAAAVARRTGLDLEAARRARARTGDEPFWAEPDLSEVDHSRLVVWARHEGLRLVHGGRFLHLTGSTDKGMAARRVLQRLGATGEEWTRAAFGDAASDAPLLEAVEHRFAVRRPDGGVDPALHGVPEVFVARGVGPRGFCEGVENLLARFLRAI